jgi:hypothetical protein
MSEATFSNNLNELTDLLRKRWDDLALEALVGIFSTVITDDQLQVLVKSLREEYGVTKRRQNV